MAPSQRELLPAYRGLPKGSYLGLTRLTNYSYVPILSFPPPMRSRADYGGNPGLEMLHLHSHSPPPRGQASRKWHQTRKSYYCLRQASCTAVFSDCTIPCGMV